MGVRFVVRLREGKPPDSDLQFPFEQTRIVIGRGAAADVRIPHRTVSEFHATVQLRGDSWLLADASSTNGTRLNGQRLDGDRARKLREGDQIELGAYVLSFHLGVLGSEPISAEGTAELARRLMRDAYAARAPALPAARLCVISGPHTGEVLEIPPAPSRMLIGSREGCQLRLCRPAVAAEHAEVVHDLDGVLLRGLGDHMFSHAGCAVRARRLRDADEIVVGETRLLFEEPAQVAIDALKNEPDLRWTPAQKPAATTESIEPPPAPPVLVPSSAGEEPALLQREHSDADVLIYALAAIVLVASTLGLVMLLGSS